MNTPAIEIKDLVVRYGGVPAVDGLNLTVPRGVVFGFLGPNGAGKTTTIKALLGLRRPDAGSARILGYDVVRESLEVRARVGFVSEVNSLYDFMTIPQISAFFRETARTWDSSIVDRFSGGFGLPRDKKIGQFSRGMKSQLALALALGGNPEVLILDEPTAGLDPLARREVLNTLVSEIAAAGKTVFFSSHILAEVEAVADWVGILYAGKLIVSAELDQLKLQHQVLRLTYAKAPPANEIAALRGLPDVLSAAQEGRSVRVLARGGTKGLEAAVHARELAPRTVETLDLDLDDIFALHIKEAKSDRQGTA
jgi:ABC-2 type transport system ATP-binding protein